MAEIEKDSFDLLLKELHKQGFQLPHVIRQRDYNAEQVVSLGGEAHQLNRDALIRALTNSGWVAG